MKTDMYGIYNCGFVKQYVILLSRPTYGSKGDIIFTGLCINSFFFSVQIIKRFKSYKQI